MLFSSLLPLATTTIFLVIKSLDLKEVSESVTHGAMCCTIYKCN